MHIAISFSQIKSVSTNNFFTSLLKLLPFLSFWGRARGDAEDGVLIVLSAVTWFEKYLHLQEHLIQFLEEL